MVMVEGSVCRIARDDITAQCHAIEENGFCIIEGALGMDQSTVLAERLCEQANAELIQQGVDGEAMENAPQDDSARWVAKVDDPTQWVSMLPNKGQEFITLAINPPILNLARKLIGKACVVSEFSARVTKPGSPAMALHSDQWWLPQPTMPGEQQMPVADISRDQVGLEHPTPATRPIAPRAVMTTLYALADVTADMGPTRLVPGSHLSGGIPRQDREYETVAPELNKGDAVVFDGRLWHGANPNRSRQDRLTALILYTGPQFRQLTNYTYGLRPEVAANLSDAARDVFGYRLWNAYGATDDYSATYATPGELATGELKSG